MIGRIISTKMQNTVVVLVENVKKHPLYKKTYKRSKKYLVDSSLDVKMGDLVEFIKIRPKSKNKHWKVAKVVGRNIEEMIGEELQEKAAQAIKEVMPKKEENGTA